MANSKAIVKNGKEQAPKKETQKLTMDELKEFKELVFAAFLKDFRDTIEGGNSGAYVNATRELLHSAKFTKALYRRIAASLPTKQYVLKLNEVDRRVILNKIKGSCIGDDLIKTIEKHFKDPVETVK